MFGLFRKAPQPASRSPTPESAFHRQGPIPPIPVQWQKFLLLHRVAINSSGAIATDLPSTGGILIKHVNAVDLEHLSASRNTSTARPSPNVASQGDGWCAKLRSLAPAWYRTMSDWYCTIDDKRPQTTAELQQTFIAYPSSPKSGPILVIRSVDGAMPEGWGAYDMCFTMQERCDVMQQCGAIAYDTVGEVEELTGRYEERMKRERDALEKEYGSFEA